MAKRLFLSIPLSKDFLNAFETYQKDNPVKGVRWVSRENLHITVYFFGNVDEAHFSDVIDQLSKSTQQSHPFILKFQKTMFAPPGRAARMIWATFEKNAPYQKFVLNISEEVKAFVHLEREKRDPIAHITLGRFKNPYLAKKLVLPPLVVDNPILNVTECHLVESQLLPQGASYSILETYKL